MQVGGGFVERKGGMVPGTQHRTVINCCQMSSNVTKFYQVHLIVPLYPFVSVSDYSDFMKSKRWAASSQPNSPSFKG